MTNRSAPVLAAVLLAGCAHAAASPAGRPTTTVATRNGGGQQQQQVGDTTGRGGGAGTGSPSPKPYNRVITAEAKTRRGMFAVHRVGEKLYFEIPAKEMNKDMLLVGRYARAAAADPNLPPGQFGQYGGDQFGESTLRWERNGNRVVLRAPSFDITADTA
ncbi:MAG TPA: DUF5118 domain-containing protein, partial [Gemmatimonadaceae bacterium]|nr:DUF5118 domain-containing protein [Gemmatimonadaceae bacterium]